MGNFSCHLSIVTFCIKIVTNLSPQFLLFYTNPYLITARLQAVLKFVRTFCMFVQKQWLSRSQKKS